MKNEQLLNTFTRKHINGHLIFFYRDEFLKCYWLNEKKVYFFYSLFLHLDGYEFRFNKLSVKSYKF